MANGAAADGRRYLAVDLGASSGRVLAGAFSGAKLSLAETHRFGNGPVAVNESLHWDLLRLWSDVQEGLRAAAHDGAGPIASVGVDTWGVDFGLLGRGDVLLGNPYHYRDARTAGLLARLCQEIGRDTIFIETGLQFMELNTIFQLYAMQLQRSPLLEAAEHMLLMPDLFHWLLTGEKANEFTDASTTQLLNPHTGSWSKRLIEELRLPERIFGRIAHPGTDLGPVRPRLAEQLGLTGARVVLPGTHDTASAVMAVPTASAPSARPDWCYISSGTWSLMGVETPQPVVTPLCQELNFTNEGGIGGTTRLLKNIAGLWLVQECRRAWQLAGREFTWEQLVRMAEAAPPLVSLFEPDAARFTAPADMPAAIREYCREKGEPVPESEGAVIRAALESLALRYRMVLGWLEQLTGSRIEVIHIVGGGSQNALLCQMAADCCARRVIAGPVEATAIGNLAMQAVALGDIQDVAAAREVIRQSFEVREYTPRNTAPWDAAYGRFEKLLAR